MGILKKSTRKILVSLAGFPIIALGIVLIPLPGPGILVVILGLFILSLEFDWANRYMNKLKETQKKALEKARSMKEDDSAKENKRAKDSTRRS